MAKLHAVILHHQHLRWHHEYISNAE